MNILFLSESFHPHGSGGELATNLYANLLVKHGCNVTVVTNRFQDEAEKSVAGNLTIYRLPLSKENTIGKYSTLRKLDVPFSNFMNKLMKWADMIYIPGFWYSAIPMAKAYRRPFIVHLHGYFPICPLATFYDISKERICNHKSGLCSPKCIYIHERSQGRSISGRLASVVLNSTVGRYLSRLIRLADAIICVSEAQRNMIVTHRPSLGAKTHVIYNPIPKLSQVEIDKDDFGYFGGPSYLKGFNILCQALACLPRTIRVHATNFPVDGWNSVRSLDKLSMIPYHRLNYTQQRQFYEQIRGVLFPSITFEPFPYVIAEAILRGRIVIASKIGGIPEQVEGCKGAFLVEAGDYRSLAEELQYVDGLSREVVADLGTQSRKVFMSNFNNERTIRNFIRVCENLQPC